MLELLLAAGVLLLYFRSPRARAAMRAAYSPPERAAMLAARAQQPGGPSSGTPSGVPDRATIVAAQAGGAALLPPPYARPPGYASRSALPPEAGARFRAAMPAPVGEAQGVRAPAGGGERQLLSPLSAGQGGALRADSPEAPPASLRAARDGVAEGVRGAADGRAGRRRLVLRRDVVACELLARPVSVRRGDGMWS